MAHDRGQSRWGALVAIGFAAAAVPAYALAVSGFEALDALERGRWTIGTAGRVERSVCLGDPTILVQLVHADLTCEQELVASDRAGGTVHYTCAGRGYGRTSIRVATPRIARIETQGLIDGRPFHHRFEARKVGACSR